MLQKTNKLFIGKDISRDAQVVDGASMYTITLSTGLADGEVVVLDKFKKVLAAGATVADTDTIFICQGTGNTFSYSNEAGTAVTGARKIRMSDPIKGNLVKSYTGKSYTAKAEQVTTFDVTALAAVVVDTEYLIRIVYKDMNEHPGQFTATYRHTPAVTTLATFTDNMMDAVNAHAGRRVQATSTGTTIVLTGLPMPECTSTVTDIDKFSMVQFEAYLLYVTSKGYWAECTITSKVTTGPTYGSGTWESIRDMEKESWGYLGITNRTQFPVQLPDACVVKNATYDLIHIEHENDYLSPDNQYVKNFPLLTTIAFVVPTTGTQESEVLAKLNTWMASCAGSFNAVTV
jgi:hypothetical protein